MLDGILRSSNFRLMVSVFLFVLFFFIRFPSAILVPYPSLGGDEFAIMSSSVALFANQIPTNLHVPAGTVSGLLFISYSIDFLATHSTALTSAVHGDFGAMLCELSKYMAEFFFNPARQLIIGRLIVVFISSLAPLALFLFFRRKGMLGAVITALLFVVSPLFFRFSSYLLSDTVAMTFYLFSLVTLINTEQLEKKKIILSGVFLGLSISSKFIYLPFIAPAVFLLCSLPLSQGGGKYRERFQAVILFFVSFLVPVLIFVPFIWIAPLTVLKAVVGHIFERNLPGMERSWGLVPKVLISTLTWPGIFFGMLGLFYSFRIFKLKRALFLIFVLIFFLLPAGLTTMFFDRYLIPLLPTCYIYIGLAIHGLIAPPRNRFRVLGVLVIAAGIIFWQAASNAQEIHKRREDIIFKQSSVWIDKFVKPKTSVAIPADLKECFIPDEVALGRALNILQDRSRFQSRISGLFDRANTDGSNLPLSSPLLFAVFGDYEKQELFAVETMIWYLQSGYMKRNAYDIWLYAQEPDLTVISGFQDIVRKFNEGEIEVIVSKAAIPELNSYADRLFNQSYGQGLNIYRRTLSN